MDMNTDTETTYDSLAEAWGYDTAAVEAWCENNHLSPEEAEDYESEFTESYAGQMTLREYVSDLVDNHVGDDWIRMYINYDGLANDLRMEGYWEEGGYLFRP